VNWAPEAPKKRKTRFVRAILIALLLFCVLWTVTIIGIFAVEDALPPIEPRIALIKSTVICTGCGAVSKGKAFTFLGVDLTDYREPVFAPIAPSFIATNTCDHKDVLETVGLRVRILSVYPSEWRLFKSGYLDNDFFSSAPALQEALSSVAKTNLIAAQNLLSGVIHLRLRGTSAATKVLPALESTDMELLKSQLSATDLAEEGAAEIQRLRRGAVTNGI
jgi:hypothetical protein